LANRKKRGRDLHGLFVLDKPLGMSSNQALQRVKYLFNAKKAGHTGTLDPLATGVLVVCFGRATKAAEHIVASSKTYYVRAKLGQKTSTGDAEGELVAESDVTAEQLQQLEAVVAQFVGEIEQIPPMFSALKHDGQPLYKLAREGVEIEREARTVNIYAIKELVQDLAENTFDMVVDCSKGTYIRTLVEDIGEALGCGAHIHILRRSRVGGFQKSMTIDELEQRQQTPGADIAQLLQPLEMAFAEYPKVVVKEGLLQLLAAGRVLNLAAASGSSFVAIYNTNGIFRGLGHVNEDGLVKFQNFSAHLMQI